MLGQYRRSVLTARAYERSERAENRLNGNGAVSEGHRKRWSVSGTRRGGCGEVTEATERRGESGFLELL